MVTLCRCWAVVVVLLSLLAPAQAASPTITPEQLKAYEQLTPAQREALGRRLERTGATGEKQSETPPPDSDVVRPPEESDDPIPRPRKIKLPRIKAGDTLLLTISPKEKALPDFAPARDGARPLVTPESPDAPTAAEPRPLDQAKHDAEVRLREARLPQEQLFVVDLSGAVTLKNIGRIALAGLNEKEAALRIDAEPALKGMRATIKILPLEEELKPFGYDIFRTGNRRPVATAADIPVPAEYVVGPGDTVLVQLFGKENIEHELVVTRDGTLPFPGIGPIPVAGMTFSQLQAKIKGRVQKQLIGARASVSLGKLRSVRVFVTGDVERPGSYVMSGLATVTNALLASGGVRGIGSLRDIQLKRGGKLVSRFDLYDLLLRGDNHGDARLAAGDVVFVPPVGKSAGVAGRVRRPAIYELKGEKSIAELVAMAGGLLPDAYPQAAHLERIGGQHERALIALDLTSAQVRDTELSDGDVVRIDPVLTRVAEAVRISGHVYRPGHFAWRPGLRLTDLIPSRAALREQGDAHYLLVKREVAGERGIELLGADLAAALAAPDSGANLALAPGDEVRVFDVHEDRAALISPWLEQARAVSAPERPEREVSIGGAVHHAGRYPWAPGMGLRNLLAAAGGMTDRAYTLEAELTRFTVADGKARAQSREVISLAQVLKGGKEGDVPLQPYDQLVIQRVPSWEEDGVIEIVGEVKFPGKYPIARGEKLSTVLQRAGGPTPFAFPGGAIFVRESVRLREQEYLLRLTTQLERDLALIATEGSEVGVKKEAALAEGQALLRQMRAAKAAGRMVIKLDAVLDGGGYDIVVQPGDKLHVPQRPDEVTVVGEVYYPTSHLYVSDYSRDQYVRLSGGITERGHKRAAYVVHADGSVTPPSGWFGGDVEVGPGDTIIVPLKVERISNLKLFSDISTILFQLAVTAAALDTIGVL